MTDTSGAGRKGESVVANDNGTGTCGPLNQEKLNTKYAMPGGRHDFSAVYVTRVDFVETHQVQP